LPRWGVRADRAEHPEPYQKFKSLLDQTLKKYNTSFNVFAKIATSIGVKMTFNRIRDVYYGRVIIMASDIAEIKKVADTPVKEVDLVKILTMYRSSVDEMCRACAGSSANPSCWDATCPLRPASPLPLAGVYKLDNGGEDELL